MVVLQVVSALECIADRKARQLREDLYAVKSYLARTRSDINGRSSYDKRFEGEMVTSREFYVENQMSRSFSLTSSSSRTSTSFSRSSFSSVKSEKLKQRVQAGIEIPVLYAEMHN